MNQEYHLYQLDNDWATFYPTGDSGYKVSSRCFTISVSTWKELKKPLSLLIAVEGLESKY